MLDLNQLNDAQRSAVMHGEGPLLVIAGPGSGKTFTITQRIFWLIDHEHIPPEQILVITFTKDAALSMQRRFLEGSSQVLPVHFGTFHSVFYHIIRESYGQGSYHILTDKDKKKILIPIIHQFNKTENTIFREDDLSVEVAAVFGALSLYKNTGERERAEALLSEGLKIHFTEILERYEQVRRSQKAMDFDDMVYECENLLSNNENLRNKWQKRFRHILMDEFQDMNPAQYRVIRLLAGEPFNLFAVGDDDQSIYGFRGAKPDCLKQFVKDYGAKELYLDINYRSREEIIQAAGKVIRENKNRFGKEIKAAEHSKVCPGECVALHAFREREEEYQYLVSTLEQVVQGKSIGVLFRTNGYMQGLAVRLSKAGISYRMKEKVQNIYEHFIVKDIMAYLKVAAGKGNRSLFLQILNKPSRFISREAIGRDVVDYGQMKAYYRKDGISPTSLQHIQTIEQLETQMSYLGRLSPFLGVQYIRRVIGYEGYLKKKAGKETEKWREWEEILAWLGSDAADYETLEEWCEAQGAYGQKLQKGGESEDEEVKIHLMTVHGAKGLEFDTVYIPDCNEKVYPHGNLPEQEACEEERRILYVAMTRAKENLELLYLTGTKERPRLPSRFLNPLIKDYSSTISSNSHSSKYSSNASATFS